MKDPTARLYVRHWTRGVTDVLGPGRRSVIWLQGCARGCEGCIAPEMQPHGEGKGTDAFDLAEQVLEDDEACGITVSGGEPFDQSAGLAILLEITRARGRNTWVYTGHRLEELVARDDPWTDRALAATDILVDGPYVQDEAGGYPYRGSTNQRLIVLGDDVARGATAVGGASRITISLDDHGEMIVVGIPPSGFLERFEEQLSRRGLAVVPRDRWR